jgi:hypothetical protein
MISRGQGRTTIMALGSAALAAVGTIALAQQDEPPAGSLFTLDISAGASIDDNQALNDPSLGTTTRTDLGATLRFLDETAVSRLAVSLFTRGEFARSPDDDLDGFNFRLPTATADYTILGPNSRLSLNARYVFERVDEDVLVFLDENLNPVDLLIDGGELRRITLGANFSTGIEGPLGLDVGASFDNRDYIDTTDPDLFDRRSVRANAALRFQLTPVMTGRLTGSISRLDDDTAGDPRTETMAYGAGLTYALDPITTFSADAAFTTVEETAFGTTLSETDGIAFTLSAQREMRNGVIGARVARTINEAATRTLISFDRGVDLRDGSLSYSIGYSFSEDDGDDALVGSLDYVRELRTSRLSARLSQEAVSSDGGDDTLVTRIAVGFNQEINSASSLGVDFGLGRSDTLVAGGDTTTRANLGVSYRRELTRDWDWVLGYEARLSRETGGSDATSNRVFTRIDRSFTFRP